eukprot:CAMPEP_0170570256 /NCGR_PEP_ID=MMETSP0224-20130122/1009_1 /TAXON_ID=285029 /ORGANISM="Togula jolla, Strain CCCM 725" /LENGTH=462 /DNA_ID=CAMNT_0010892513 /DNA_START=1 /DNA_END=1389 /DNA_ORIENTATION=+
MIELIPGRISWLPGCSAPPSGYQGGFALAQSLCRPHAEVESGQNFPEVPGAYSVPHYVKKACGRAFGPLGLDQIVWFCRGVDVELGASGMLAVGSPEGDDEARANAAVLVGAYLVLRCGSSHQAVRAVMGDADSTAKFSCSWARADILEPERTLEVQDCWHGLELARDHGWLPACETDEDSARFCQNYQALARIYDASWIIPGLFLVCADPLTTVCDPNPETFTAIFDDQAETHDETEALVSTPKRGAGLPESSHLGYLNDVAEDAGDQPSRANSTLSCDTICKEYTPAHAYTYPSLKTGSFFSFLQQNDIQLLVRANFLMEPGMPRKSYDGNDFVSRGVQHLDLPVPDHHGGLPSASEISRLLEAASGYATGRGDAIALHCKGGFGRSIVLASLLIVERLDVPGNALLGWVRMARPGSVNTTSQERFIAGLKGRTDVWRAANNRGIMSGAKTRCTPGCTVS